MSGLQDTNRLGCYKANGKIAKLFKFRDDTRDEWSKLTPWAPTLSMGDIELKCSNLLK